VTAMAWWNMIHTTTWSDGVRV